MRLDQLRPGSGREREHGQWRVRDAEHLVERHQRVRHLARDPVAALALMRPKGRLARPFFYAAAPPPPGPWRGRASTPNRAPARRAACRGAALLWRRAVRRRTIRSQVESE